MVMRGHRTSACTHTKCCALSACRPAPHVYAQADVGVTPHVLQDTMASMLEHARACPTEYDDVPFIQVRAAVGSRRRCVSGRCRSFGLGAGCI